MTNPGLIEILLRSFHSDFCKRNNSLMSLDRANFWIWNFWRTNLFPTFRALLFNFELVRWTKCDKPRLNGIKDWFRVFDCYEGWNWESGLSRDHLNLARVISQSTLSANQNQAAISELQKLSQIKLARNWLRKGALKISREW